MFIRLGDVFAPPGSEDCRAKDGRWPDLAVNLAPVACPTTPLSVAMPPSQWGIVAAIIAGVLALALPTGLARAQGYPAKYDFGATATEQEIAAVAIAIPADGKG